MTTWVFAWQRWKSVAGVPGDYNANNVVDAGDYVLWRKYSGQSVTLPNDSTPGTVTPADYTCGGPTSVKRPPAAAPAT